MAAASDAPLRFRNYVPNDATLRESAEPAQPLPTAQDPHPPPPLSPVPPINARQCILDCNYTHQ